jgi:hypothetical protein
MGFLKLNVLYNYTSRLSIFLLYMYIYNIFCCRDTCC